MQLFHTDGGKVKVSYRSGRRNTAEKRTDLKNDGGSPIPVLIPAAGDCP